MTPGFKFQTFKFYIIMPLGDTGSRAIAKAKTEAVADAASAVPVADFVADATDAASAITQCNAVIAALIAAGLMASE